MSFEAPIPENEEQALVTKAEELKKEALPFMQDRLQPGRDFIEAVNLELASMKKTSIGMANYEKLSRIGTELKEVFEKMEDIAKK